MVARVVAELVLVPRGAAATQASGQTIRGETELRDLGGQPRPDLSTTPKKAENVATQTPVFRAENGGLGRPNGRT